MVRRLEAVFVALLALFALVLVAAPAGAAPTGSRRDAQELEFVARINRLRASKGLGELHVDPALREVARAWAADMAAAGRISHRTDLVDVAPHPRWVKIGENVGVGGDVDSLHRAFVGSPAHYANLVDRGWQYIGIGIVYDGDTIYVAENFMQVEGAASAPPQLVAVHKPLPLSCEANRCPAPATGVARR